MPYINPERRFIYRIEGPYNSPEAPSNAGELNYLLTTVCLDYIKDHGSRYQQINDIVGALECCKLEFYRRLAAPYEDTKIVENGDVYEAEAD